MVFFVDEMILQGTSHTWHLTYASLKAFRWSCQRISAFAELRFSDVAAIGHRRLGISKRYIDYHQSFF